VVISKIAKNGRLKDKTSAKFKPKSLHWLTHSLKFFPAIIALLFSICFSKKEIDEVKDLSV
jgi:hypothetical protein